MTSLRLWDGRTQHVGKIVGIGRNYVAHAKEMGSTAPANPLFFLKPSTSIIQDGESIVLPRESTRVDWETELGVVIGVRARNVEPHKALSHVLGYCVLLDVTARDLQENAKRKGEPWTLSKGFDTFTPCSTVLDAARVGDPQSLELELRVNGTRRQHGYTKDMVHSVAQIVSYLSTVMTLEPGDLIATGTPEGVGPMHKGDKLHATTGPLSLTAHVA